MTIQGAAPAVVTTPLVLSAPAVEAPLSFPPSAAAISNQPLTIAVDPMQPADTSMRLNTANNVMDTPVADVLADDVKKNK